MDATERLHDSYADGTADQAEYFGISRPEVMKLGQSAATFTRKRLEGRKFTIHTRCAMHSAAVACHGITHSCS